MDDEKKRQAFDMTVWIVALAMGLVLVAHAAMAQNHARHGSHD